MRKQHAARNKREKVNVHQNIIPSTIHNTVFTFPPPPMMWSNLLVPKLNEINMAAKVIKKKKCNCFSEGLSQRYHHKLCPCCHRSRPRWPTHFRFDFKMADLLNDDQALETSIFYCVCVAPPACIFLENCIKDVNALNSNVTVLHECWMCLLGICYGESQDQMSEHVQ